MKKDSWTFNDAFDLICYEKYGSQKQSKEISILIGIYPVISSLKVYLCLLCHE